MLLKTIGLKNFCKVLNIIVRMTVNVKSLAIRRIRGAITIPSRYVENSSKYTLDEIVWSME